MILALIGPGIFLIEENMNIYMASFFCYLSFHDIHNYLGYRLLINLMETSDESI
ncbi:MAG: hypothetical protein Ct9H300mP20_16370 [Gammaproteobacteria bacterium]|nr:MAG: hypothetical protein Ct9H300mP20_16370 [Gammaproteobacteria bacterium]